MKKIYLEFPIQQFFGIWKHISKRNKYRYYLTLFISLINAATEFIGIASIIPFITFLISPEKINDLNFIIKIKNIFGLVNDEKLISIFFIYFVFVYIFLIFIRLFNLRYTNLLCAEITSNLSKKVFSNLVRQKYIFHTKRNSSEFITLLTTAMRSVTSVLQAVVYLFTGSFILTAIILGLLIINTKLTLFIFLLFSFIYLIITIFIRKRLIRNSKIQLHEAKKLTKTIQEGLGFIIDLIIGNNQEKLIKIQNKHDKEFRKKIALNIYYSTFPKYLIEGIAIIVIIFASLFIIRDGSSLKDLIPIFGVFAFGAQKLLPSFQLIFSSWANLKNESAQLKEIINVLNLKIEKDIVENNKNVSFKDKLVLKNINFNYPNSRSQILTNINLEISYGQKIGIIGPTGSGKSTLIKIILGLLEPSKGEFLVDRNFIFNDGKFKHLKSWRSLISYIPQDIFISDGSLAENIAFSEKDKFIDMKKVRASASKANLSDFIETLPNSYDEKIGERGVRLSGGQKQRIGIARALYKGTEILILDEATNSLDKTTEKLVMQDMMNSNKNLTIISISHNINSLKGFNEIYEIINGQLIKKS